MSFNPDTANLAKARHHQSQVVSTFRWIGAVAICFAAVSLYASSTDVADAAKARDAVAVKALLKSGADVNAAQGDGMTALHWAAANGDAALTQMLLSAGANIRATTLPRRHHAAADGEPGRSCAGGGDAARRRRDANSSTATGATALMLAARSGSTETVTRLVETGADVNAKKKDSARPR